MQKVAAVVVLIVASFVCAQEKPADAPRVFVTDSQSWETHGSGGGNNGSWGSSMRGGARPQTAEIIKTFGERCPSVIVNNIEGRADYIVELDHEGGKGALSHHNKIAIFERVSGDVIASKSTLSLGGSVQEACDVIQKHWPLNAARLRGNATTTDTQFAVPRAATQSIAAPGPVPEIGKSHPITFRLSSNPDGADIEIDGSFVGNTPSTIEATPGEHTVAVRKKGFKAWEKKMKVPSGGEIRINAELEPQS